jgi:Tol biopolymer transport system component
LVLTWFWLGVVMMLGRKRRQSRSAAVVVVLLVAGGASWVGGHSASAHAPGVTTRVSVSSLGGQGDAHSVAPAISADGRFVAFYTQSKLVPGDTGNFPDVYVRDRAAESTRRVSVDSSEAEGGGFEPAMSADGRYVAFVSWAQLVRGDTNGFHDVYVRDMAAGTTRRVSVSSHAAQGNGDSGGFGDSRPSISADGRYVAFSSAASNLVHGDRNDVADVFVRDLTAGRTHRVSVSSREVQGNGIDGSYAPSISAAGRYIAFFSWATNLVPGDTTEGRDVFVRDLATGTTSRVSVNSAEVQADSDTFQPPVISGDGRYVAFQSGASNLAPGTSPSSSWNVFLRDRKAGTTRLVSVNSNEVAGNNTSDLPAISPDGRFVAFVSSASNLVRRDTTDDRDVFVRDLAAGITRRVSVSTNGAEGDRPSTEAAISAHGRQVAFVSYATNLVPGDSNDFSDVFVRDPAR